MQSKDEIKEELGWLKVIFGVLLVAIVSMLGWFALNFETAKWPILILTIAVLGLTLYFAYKINSYAYQSFLVLRRLA
jgi:CDP-diglyceride synthetase